MKLKHFLILFCGISLLRAAASQTCTEKNIETLLTLTCTGYEEIPKDETVGPDVITSLDMKGNKLSQLTNNDFKSKRLINIQKLTLSSCQLRQIEDEALTSLKGLKDLDLSNNHIKDLSLHIFNNNTLLKIINLGNNQNLTDLTGQFPAIKTLTTIDLSNCNLIRLRENTFQLLVNLERLYLNGNSLKTLSPQLKTSLHNLHTLSLANNPWNCDCRLKDFVKTIISMKSISTIQNQARPMCHSPPEFANKTWDLANPEEFFCEPKVEFLQVDEKIIPTEDDDKIFSYGSGENVTITCEVWADPLTDINWRKDNIAVNLMRHKIEVSYSTVDNRTRTSTIIIVNSEKQDSGNYQCHAENRGGVARRNVALNITAVYIPIPPILTGGQKSKVWIWVLIGVLCFAIIAAIIIVVVVFIWRKRQRQQEIFRKEVMEKFKNSQNVIDGENKTESKDDKIPLLNENQNSPTSMPSMSMSGTETASFSHMDFRPPPQASIYHSQQFQRSVPPSPSSIYGKSFPNRPGSSLSVYLDADSRRQAYQGQKVDLMSFDSVRYQRRPPSVSSFMSLPAPEVQAFPNGYVTLPRKPRNPRWSTSTAMTDDSMQSSYSHQPIGMYSTLPHKRPHQRRPAINTGPRYDTIGPRTTADGGSTLSLNKITGGSMSALDSINTALNTSPSRGKIVSKRSRDASVITPGTGRSLHNNFTFDPIEEVESTPATSEINVYVAPKAKEDSNTLGPKYKKKKPPNLPTNIKRIKPPSNFHQRISEINKSFERPKSASEILSKETEINDSTDGENNGSHFFPKPPPKPQRTLSAPEYNDSNSVMYGVIQEEVEGTAV